MSKVLDATCVSGVVTSINTPVQAEILSEGVGQSSGVLVLDEDKAFYLAKTSGDLKQAIEDVAGLIDQVISVLSILDGVSTTPGSAASSIASLSSLKTTFLSKKDLLK